MQLDKDDDRSGFCPGLSFAFNYYAPDLRNRHWPMGNDNAAKWALNVTVSPG